MKVSRPTLFFTSLSSFRRAFFFFLLPINCQWFCFAGEKPFGCEECGKKFADRVALKNHKAREHSQEDEHIHKCSSCPRVKLHLDEMYLATGRTFLPHSQMLDLSGLIQVYRSLSDLKRHEKSHLALEDRPHQCSTCGKRFLTQTILKEHCRIHSGTSLRSVDFSGILPFCLWSNLCRRPLYPVTQNAVTLTGTFC